MCRSLLTLALSLGLVNCQSKARVDASENSGRAGAPAAKMGGTSNAGGKSGNAGNAAGKAGGGSGGAPASQSGSGGDAAVAGSESAGGADGAEVSVGVWTDAPGACPPGSKRVDITTLDQMESASRGESDADATCFFVHDGTYTQAGSTLPLYFMRGGTPNAPVVWVGESRSGVVIAGRATFEIGADHMQLSNMTLDISGVTQTGSYDTITVLASDITLSHLTLTGDCAHGSKGGHVEVPGLDDPNAPTQDHVVIDSCLIEKFGHCSDNGSLDHGIYLSSGNDIIVRNSVIVGNSSRGIQIYTHYEDSSLTLTNLLIERNLIEANGHGDYQDGMVVNGNVDANFTGPIDGVTIKNNVFWQNYYSGIRFVGNAVKNVEVSHNTFVGNGAGSTSKSRSELNLDEGTPIVTASKNVFVPANAVVNACADGLVVSDNFVSSDAPDASCVTGSVQGDPGFVDEAHGDFHARSPLANGYGAYAP